MKLTIDTDEGHLSVVDGGASTVLDLYSPEAFAELSRAWVKVGWQLRYPYQFTWLGRPIIQLPEDMVVMQEVIARVRPDVVIETGVAHGGSLVFYASLARVLGVGRVVGIDIEIRPPNRAAIEEHALADLITLVEGSSVDPAIVDEVRGHVADGERVLVILDSNHTRDHVAQELELYAPLVTPGSYLVVTDGIMFDLHDVPGGGEGWDVDNPLEAASTFLASHPEFELEEPPSRPFDESPGLARVTHWPRAFLRRR